MSYGMALLLAREMTPLPAKPFNHLSVLAYLAIGVVVFSSSLVAGYLVYSCYRSARRKDGRRSTSLGGAPSTVVHGNGIFYDVELGVYRKARRKSAMDMKTLRFGHNSESKKNIIRASDTADSQTFFEGESDKFFDLDSQVSLPPLAHTSAPCLSFQLPSPPSPSPAHKQYILRYGGKILETPVSPTPSYFPEIPVLPVFSSHDPDGIQAEREVERSRKQILPVIRSDSNDTRFVPPFAAGSTVYLYDEPKLSPLQAPDRTNRTQRRWERSRTLPTLCVKPGPGYF